MTARTMVLVAAAIVSTLLGPIAFGADAGPAPQTPAATAGPLPGMPPVVDPSNLYSETAAGHFSPAVAGALARVYVPEHGGDAVSVIDPATMKVVDHFKVGSSPQHVVPAWDLKTLWVTNNNDFHRRDGSSLTPIDPLTGKPGKTIAVTDAYNMYFMPDGSAAIVINEAQARLDFRDPHSMKLMYSITTPGCFGLNHADFSSDGTYAIFSCEFGGSIAKVDLVSRKIVAVLPLTRPADSLHKAEADILDILDSEICRSPGVEQVRYSVRPSGDFGRSTGRRQRSHASRDNGNGVIMGHGTMGRGMPQDVRLSADGTVFYVADMIADGVFLVDGNAFKVVGFLPTGPGAHGFCVSRDGKKLYVSNRGSHAMPSGLPNGRGSVSVIDFATRKVEATWPIPGGGSPDMGEVSADGKVLWFSGRFDNEVYAIDTGTGAVTKIKVGSEPHGLTVWPQPGRYSLGHTGNMR